MKRFFTHPWITVGVIAGITVFFALQLPRAVLDNNTFRFIPDDDPQRVALERLEDQYGSQITVLVGLKRKYGTVFEPEFLRELKEFGARAADLRLVESVTSLMNVDYITGDSESVTVEALVPPGFSGTPAEVAALRDRLADWDLYRNAVISRDGKSTQILVNLTSLDEDAGDKDAVAVYQEIKELASSMDFPDTEVFVTGLPAFTSVMNQSMRADLKVLIPLVAVVVLGILFLSFRRIGGVALPMLTVAVSTIWAVGLMVLLGVKLSMLATVLPVILVAVGSAYGIHIVSHYYDEMAAGGAVSRDRHAEIVFHALSRVAAPTLLAALTTLAGFVSLAFTRVVPIREFGIFASFGVLVAYLVSVFLIPSLLLIRGPAGVGASGAGNSETADSDAYLESDRVSRTVANVFGAAVRHPAAVGIAVAAVAILSVWGIRRIVIDNVLVEYFRSDTDISRSDRFIREDFAGSKTLSVVVRGSEKGDLTDPAVLKAMDDLAVYLEKEVPEVGKVTGYPQMIKRINQVFNAGESPEGLVVSAPDYPETASSDEAGEETFGDWGSFGDWGDLESDSEPFGEAAASPEEALPGAESMSRLEAVELLTKALSESGGEAQSPEDFLRAVQRSVNYRGAAYYEIPSDPGRYGKADAEGLKRLIGNYLILLSGDVSDWADDPLEPMEARLNVQLRTVGQRDTLRAVEVIRDYVADRFPPGYEVDIAGAALVENALNEQVVSSQVSSIICSLVLVFLILAVYYRSLAAGAIGIFTLGLAVAVNFTVMGLAGIKLNIGTALVGSICVGTGIDYIIHYLAAYRHETLTCADPSRVLRRTFLTSGKAILFNALSVAAGFAVLTLSKFNMLAYLGGLVAAAMLVSSTISLTVLPVLLDWLKPAFTRKE